MLSLETFSQPPLLIAQAVDPTAPCGPPEEASWLCELVRSTTGKPALARAADVLIARPITVVIILLVACLINRVARRGIRRLTARLHTEGLGSRWSPGSSDPAAGNFGTSRRSQRAEAIGTLLRSITSVTIWTVAGLMALAELGLNLGPLLAGAGVVGIALGFGAQTLVRDFLSGMFMLVEDQYGVGDVIDTGEATGTVEGISLRSTRLRSVDGVVWHVPNGEIRRIGNKSQQWSRALLDVPVPYSADIDDAVGVIQRTADEMYGDPEWSDRILCRPEVWGAERFDADSVAVRTVVTTKPLEQWPVSRQLRRRLKKAFDENGIEIPFPQRTVWMRHDEEHEEQRAEARSWPS